MTDVHVKTIGSRNGDFVSGQTDLRGVFVADGIQGVSTVIAQLDQRRYAFHRGAVELGQVPQGVPPGVQQHAVPTEKKPGGGKSSQSQSQEDQLLEGLRMQNDSINRDQQLNLQRLYKQQRKGVNVREAY